LRLQGARPPFSHEKEDMYLVSATPPKQLIGDFYETLHSCNTLPADVHEGLWLLSKIWKGHGRTDMVIPIYPPNFSCGGYTKCCSFGAVGNCFIQIPSLQESPIHPGRHSLSGHIPEI
jgi:hypothetical protein